MSRPRKPFGATHPGRLPSTMIKVLAAELTDPSRLRKGKLYAKDGSVLDIIVEPGVVTVEVQGSRSTPYVATIEVRAGDGMPLRRDISAHCTCPDDQNWDDHACKHVIAGLFTLADEVLLEPELLDLWRGNDPAAAPAHDERDDEQHDENDEQHDGLRSPTDRRGSTEERLERARRHLRLVTDRHDRDDGDRDGDGDGDRDGDGEGHEGDHPTAAGPAADPIAAMLRLPPGTALPEITELEQVDDVVPLDRELAAVLRDALAHLRIDWE